MVDGLDIKVLRAGRDGCFLGWGKYLHASHTGEMFSNSTPASSEVASDRSAARARAFARLPEFARELYRLAGVARSYHPRDLWTI